MKRYTILFALSLSLILSGCGTQKFFIGETSGQTISTDKRKMVHLFWGVIPIGKKQYFPAVENAKGYTITTKYNVVDFVVSYFTAGIVGMKTVKFEALK